MAFKLTPKQLEDMIKNNPSISINSSFGDTIDSIKGLEIEKQTKTKEKKKENPTVKALYKIHECLKNSTANYELFDNELLLVFNGAKILSRNQTDTLKEAKYSVMLLNEYKKEWFKKVSEILTQVFNNEKREHLDKFKNADLRLYLYRETDGKLYDEDNLVTGFKYLIDGLRQEMQVLENNKIVIENLILDDNQKHIKECIAYQVKTKSNLIAVRIIIGSNKPQVNSFDDFKKIS